MALAGCYIRAVGVLHRLKREGFFRTGSAVDVLKRGSQFQALRGRKDFEALVKGAGQ